jgi:hypothetical protein
VLKHAPRWLNSHQKETSTRRMETTSSPSNLDLINLKDEDVAHASIIDLERPLGRKAEKTRLNKRKSNEGTSSNVEVMLKVMMEKNKKFNVKIMKFLERDRVEFSELENKRLRIKEEKIQLAKMKEEREKMKEERAKLKEAFMKEERENLKEERNIITMNVATLPLVQQEYFRQRQLEILAKRRTNN